MASGIFTTSDLETIKEAIINLSSGNAQLLQINGRMWRKSNLDELRRTYDWMKGQVTQASSRGMHRMTFKSTSNQDDN